ncbi:hypothetical protein HDU89_001099 [Geranomyces variabilis]|nr:hypothetical protein HDU89_001099 [Geranomyces variabilis]
MYQPSAPVYATQPAPVYMQQQPSQTQFYPQPQQPQQVYTQQQQQVYSSPQPNYVSGPVYSVQPQMQQIGIPSTNSFLKRSNVRQKIGITPSSPALKIARHEHMVRGCNHVSFDAELWVFRLPRRWIKNWHQSKVQHPG